MPKPSTVILKLHVPILREAVPEDVDGCENRGYHASWTVDEPIAGGNYDVRVAVIVQVHEACNARPLGKFCSAVHSQIEVACAISYEQRTWQILRIGNNVIESTDVCVKPAVIVHVPQGD